MTEWRRVFAFGLAFYLSSAVAWAEGAGVEARVCGLPAAGFLLVAEDDAPARACRAETPLIPASTLKILTAWLALERWGPDFRFTTDFFLDERQRLWIRGRGDPMLVSEELASIAAALEARGVARLRGIVTDEHYYADDIEIPGRSGSDNPYDAPVTALAANFNTLYLSRIGGRLRSAEAQTPLTPTARRLGRHVERRQRINLPDPEDAGIYLAELLAAKLRQVGVEVTGPIRRGAVPDGLTLFYRHENSRPLVEVIRAMLRYSTNFIANQLWLDLGAEAYGPPATMEKARRYAREQVDAVFGWDDYRIVEGAGLSRRNRLSARQLVELLQRFAPWRSLLPRHGSGVRAKTGTLNGIRTLAGYIETAEGDRPFAILINSPAPTTLRDRLVEHWRSEHAAEAVSSAP